MTHQPRVLVTDSTFAGHEQEKAILAGVAGVAQVQCKTEDEVIEASEGATVLLVQWAPIGRRLFAARPEVKLVVRYGIGLDNIDLEAAAEHGVAVAHVPDYCIDEVAEHAVSLMMSVQRRLTSFDALVRAGRWTDGAQLPGPRVPMSAQTIGLVGFGRVGRRTAELLRGFGADVRVFDPAPAGPGDGASVIRVSSLAGLAGCDAISLHCPLTESTRRIVDASFLAALAKGAILINTSRGGLVDTDALVDSLVAGHLGGAGLDTFEEEPLPAEHVLLSLPNVVVSPHVAWLSEAARQRLQHEVAHEALRFLTGQPLRRPAKEIHAVSASLR